MLKLFKTTNPYAVIALLILSLFLKLGYLIHAPEIVSFQDQLLWSEFSNGFHFVFGESPFFMTFIAIINLFLQSLFFNKISRYFKLFPHDSYLPAYSYILATSLIPAMNEWSSFLFSNWLLLLTLYYSLKLYNKEKVASNLFNMGALVGLLTILIFPYIVLILLLYIALGILRPFKIKEWFILLVGFLTPIYFLLSFLFLTDRSLLLLEMIPFDFQFSPILQVKQSILSLSVLAILLFLGFIYLSKHSNRMLMQVKKSWNVIFIGFFVTLFIGFFAVWDDFYAWYPALLFFSFIFTNLWFENKKWISMVINYTLIMVILVIQWVFI